MADAGASIHFDKGFYALASRINHLAIAESGAGEARGCVACFASEMATVYLLGIGLCVFVLALAPSSRNVFSMHILWANKALMLVDSNTNTAPQRAWETLLAGFIDTSVEAKLAEARPACV